MGREIAMTITSRLQKLMRMLHLPEEVDYSLYFQIMEMNLKENLTMQFNKFIKNITQVNKSFQWNKNKKWQKPNHYKIF